MEKQTQEGLKRRIPKKEKKNRPSLQSEPAWALHAPQRQFLKHDSIIDYLRKSTPSYFRSRDSWFL